MKKQINFKFLLPIVVVGTAIAIGLIAIGIPSYIASTLLTFSMVLIGVSQKDRILKNK